MSIQRPSQSTVLQLPNLNLPVVGNAAHVVSEWVESELVDGSTVSVVMLNEFIVASVPKLDGTVLASTGNAGPIRAEFARQDCILMIREANSNLSSFKIPQPNSPIIRTGKHYTLVMGNLTLPHPVGVAQIRLFELAVHRPHL